MQQALMNQNVFEEVKDTGRLIIAMSTALSSYHTFPYNKIRTTVRKVSPCICAICKKKRHVTLVLRDMPLGGGDDRIRTGGRDFADPCLTTWLRRLKLHSSILKRGCQKNEDVKIPEFFERPRLEQVQQSLFIITALPLDKLKSTGYT